MAGECPSHRYSGTSPPHGISWLHLPSILLQDATITVILLVATATLQDNPRYVSYAAKKGHEFQVCFTFIQDGDKRGQPK